MFVLSDEEESSGDEPVRVARSANEFGVIYTDFEDKFVPEREELILLPRKKSK